MAAVSGVPPHIMLAASRNERMILEAVAMRATEMRAEQQTELAKATGYWAAAWVMAGLTGQSVGQVTG